MHTLTLDLGERRYPIYIGRQLLAEGELFTRHVAGSRVAIISNDTVAPLYLAMLRPLLRRFDPVEVILPDGEVHKTLEVLNRVYSALLEATLLVVAIILLF
ncbi:MAG: hypothetical protein AAB252_04165, partial [Pseudomonadota bacterium]